MIILDKVLDSGWNYINTCLLALKKSITSKNLLHFDYNLGLTVKRIADIRVDRLPVLWIEVL